jgi:activator of HSP90 ATPase
MVSCGRYYESELTCIQFVMKRGIPVAESDLLRVKFDERMS